MTRSGDDGHAKAGAKTGGDLAIERTQGPAGLAVRPLDLHLVIVGSIPTGPTHGEL